MTKKERKKYGLLPPKITGSDIIPLAHDLCGSGRTTPFPIRIPAKAYTLIAHTMIDPATGCFEIVEATNKSARICFITPGWHNTCNLNLFSLTMRANSNVSSSTNVCERQLWH
jgi:hypothetical protein